MKPMRKAVTIVVVVMAVQVCVWAGVGRHRLPSRILEEHLRAVQVAKAEWMESGDQGTVPILVAADLAECLGEETVETLTKTADGLGLSLEVAPDWGGDRLSYAESLNTPLVARVWVGNVGLGCSQVYSVDFVFLLGAWIKVPEEMRLLT